MARRVDTEGRTCRVARYRLRDKINDWSVNRGEVLGISNGTESGKVVVRKVVPDRVEGEEEREVEVAVKVFDKQSLNCQQMKIWADVAEKGDLIDFIAIIEWVNISLTPYGVATERGLASLGDIFTGAESGLNFDTTNRIGVRVTWDDTKCEIAAYGIAAGLAHLHEKDIPHRKLRPENVILDDNLWPQVSDYVMSWLFTDQATLTRFPAILYLAPEVLNGTVGEKSSVDDWFRCDVYSYGMILYQLVVGLRPWSEEIKLPPINPRGDTPMTEERQRAEQEIQKRVKSGQRPAIPEGLVGEKTVQLIRRCWASDPEGRPTFKDILLVLEGLGEAEHLAGTDVVELQQYQKEIHESLEKANMPRRVRK
jgi:hypothetical protein